MQEKGQLAYEVIKKKIITGELAPLSDISEKKFQEELGTSRTPVHEAIARLRDENFVYTFPRKGTFVTDITVETVRAVYEMRLLNEPYLTRHAIGSVPREWLEDILYRLGHWSEEMDLAEKNAYFQGLDTELHTTIASYNENIFLRNGLRNVYDHDQRIRIKRRKTPLHPDQLNISRQEHVAIVEAMLKEDGALVEELCRFHIIHSRDMIYEVMYGGLGSSAGGAGNK